MTSHNVIILVKSVFSRDKNKNCYYNVFLEKLSNEIPKKISFCIKYECYIMKEVKFLKEFMLVNQKTSETV